MLWDQIKVLFGFREPEKRCKAGRKPAGSAQGNRTTQPQPANKTRKPMACTFHGKCISCIFHSWQCLYISHSGNYKRTTNAMRVGLQRPTGGALTEMSVTLRSGMDTRHGTHVFSFLLMRSVSGLLINGCSKSKEGIQTEGQLNRSKRAFWLSLTHCELARGSGAGLISPICDVPQQQTHPECKGCIPGQPAPATFGQCWK